MTESASNLPRSTRRALLGGLTLGAASVVAGAVKPTAAEATQGQALIAGQANDETGSTFIANIGDFFGTTGNALELDGASFGGSGLVARSYGFVPAIDGQAQGTSNGVTGQTPGPDASGVYGQNDGGGFGVAGRSNSANGTGVLAEATGAGGTALLGISGDGGTALNVKGKAQFSRSGRKVIPEGLLKVTLMLTGVTKQSLIFATMQKHAAGFTVESVVPSAGTFTIWLNNVAPAGGLPVAWFVVN